MKLEAEGKVLRTRLLRNGWRKLYLSNGSSAILTGVEAAKPAAFFTGKTYRLVSSPPKDR